MEHYLKYNSFLADINNERPSKNATYRQNLASLEKLVLYRFKDDVTVVPRDSAWFAFYNGSRLLPMQETELYQVCGRGCTAAVFCEAALEMLHIDISIVLHALVFLYEE